MATRLAGAALLLAGCAAAAAPDSSVPSAADLKAFTAAVQRGDAAFIAQDYDRAIYEYVQALNKSPHDAATLSKIGAIEDARGNAAQAEKAFELAHAADPKEMRIDERLARLYLLHGKTDAAAALYTEVLNGNPHRARALQGMGEVCAARSDYRQAQDFFNRALAEEGADKPSILTHLGYAKAQSGDYPGAEADFRAALSLTPRDDAWRYLGDLQARRGDMAGALETLLNLMDTAQAYNEIGAVLMTQKKYADARQYFTKAIAASAAYYEEAQKNLALADEHLRNPAG